MNNLGTCIGSPISALLVAPAPVGCLLLSAAVSVLTTRLLTSSAADMRSSSVKSFRWRRSAAGGVGRAGQRALSAVRRQRMCV